MKRKIVVKVSMTCDECRSKALQTVSPIIGLTSVTIEGPERDRVVLVGEDIDTVYLLAKLRKKVGDAEIVTVEEVKPPPDKDKKPQTCEPVIPKCPPPPCHLCPPPPCHLCPPPYPPCSYRDYPVCDGDPPCIIM